MKQPNMLELKFGSRTAGGNPDASCCTEVTSASDNNAKTSACCRGNGKEVPKWIVGVVETPAGPIGKVSTELSRADRWDHFKCRTSAFRNKYMVEPGLYAVGNADRNSDVLVSANYKFSFDVLRRELNGLSAWILVLDTKGINVWCAAGKGTFGTAELIKRISLSRLSEVVDHRKIVVPQLGAPGLSAHLVAKATGFRVHYGPVRAKDIPAYIAAGYKAERSMRAVTFGLLDRLVLTPMEINPAMKKYPLYCLIVLVLFGLSPSGVLFRDAITGGLPFLALGLVSVISGAFLTPLLLPFIPFRSFAIKGWITGMIFVLLSIKLFAPIDRSNALLSISEFLFFPLASSYIALQFTGSTTFTGMSGVKKELKISIPIYIISSAVSVLLVVAFKLTQWRML